MKSSPILATLVFLSAAQVKQVSAAEYLYINTQNGDVFKAKTTEWLNATQCKPETINAGFSGSYDFHLFCVKGSSRYRFAINTTQHSSFRDLADALISSGTGKMLGISGPDAHFVTWVAQ
jgi:hypothetical protein